MSELKKLSAWKNRGLRWIVGLMFIVVLLNGCDNAADNKDTNSEDRRASMPLARSADPAKKKRYDELVAKANDMLKSPTFVGVSEAQSCFREAVILLPDEDEYSVFVKLISDARARQDKMCDSALAPMLTRKTQLLSKFEKLEQSGLSQDEATISDVRQELAGLNVEIAEKMGSFGREVSALLNLIQAFALDSSKVSDLRRLRSEYEKQYRPFFQGSSEAEQRAIRLRNAEEAADRIKADEERESNTDVQLSHLREELNRLEELEQKSEESLARLEVEDKRRKEQHKRQEKNLDEEERRERQEIDSRYKNKEQSRAKTLRDGLDLHDRFARRHEELRKAQREESKKAEVEILEAKNELAALRRKLRAAQDSRQQSQRQLDFLRSKSREVGGQTEGKVFSRSALVQIARDLKEGRRESLNDVLCDKDDLPILETCWTIRGIIKARLIAESAERAWVQALKKQTTNKALAYFNILRIQPRDSLALRQFGQYREDFRPASIADAKLAFNPENGWGAFLAGDVNDLKGHYLLLQTCYVAQALGPGTCLVKLEKRDKRVVLCKSRDKGSQFHEYDFNEGGIYNILGKCQGLTYYETITGSRKQAVLLDVVFVDFVASGG